MQGALVSLDPTTGRVLAMVGGWSFEGSQFNRATQAQRQPGSSFKPFVYLTALEKGISPSQRFLDAPIVMDTAAGRWRPNNFEMEFGGPTPLRIALEKSLNLVTLRVAQTVGMEAIAQTAIAFHEVESMPRVLPAALGAVETTVLREAGAYASLATGGHEVIPTLIDSVQDPDGHVVWRPSAISCDDCSDQGKRAGADRPAQGDRRSGSRVPARHHDAGRDDARHRRAGGRRARPSDRRQDRHDAGLHRRLVLRLHARSGDRRSGSASTTRRRSATTRPVRAVAGPIWHDFMAVALKNRPVLTFQAPPGVTMATWDSGSGTRDRRVQAGSGAGRLAPDRRRRGDAPGGRTVRRRRGVAGRARRGRQQPGRDILAAPLLRIVSERCPPNRTP